MVTNEKIILRILENLIFSAIKFCYGKVLVKARKRTEHISIEVWNDEQGILLSEREAVFDAFYQNSPLGKNRRKELGLSIVKRLVKSLGWLRYFGGRPARNDE